MTYTLLTHVPTYAGQSPGVVRVSEAYRDDLLAQAAALRAAGFSLVWSTPRHDAPDARSLARERFAEFRPAEHGIADAPLPAYRTMRQFMAVQAGLKNVIEAATRGAGVVQMGAGGHPMALGQFAWPLIDPAKSKRVFVFAGDPLPGRRRGITSGRNPAKRLLKSVAVKRFEAFCRQAVGEADLVFAHDPAVPRQFARQWNERCHAFMPAGTGDADLAPAAVLASRQKRIADTSKPVRAIALATGDATAGVEHVLRAVAKLRRLGVAMTLTLSGVAKPAALSALIQELKLTNAATVSAGDLRTDLDAADLLVSAPLVPGENAAIESAAARGLAVVAYRSGVTDAALADAGGAVLVERGETDLLSQALLDVAGDRLTLAALAESSRGWAAGVTRDALHRRRAELVRGVIGS